MTGQTTNRPYCLKHPNLHPLQFKRKGKRR